MPKHITYLCVLITCWVYLIAPAIAKFHQKAVVPNEVENQLRQLASQPELLNLEYLSLHYGRPENESSQKGGFNRIYYWYNPDHKLNYELHQSMEPGNQSLESSFVMHLEESGIKLDDIEKIFGPSPHHFYDYQSNLVEQYELSPNTVLTFISPRNSFRVTEARVAYKGPALNAPSATQIQNGQYMLLNRAHQAAEQHNWSEAVPLLQSVIKQQPDNAQAHLVLGQCYRQQGYLHEAIEEYKTALNVCGSDEQTRQQCLSGLAELRVAPYAELRGNGVTTKRKGQHLQTSQ